MKPNEKRIIEAIIFAAPSPVADTILCNITDTPKKEIQAVIDEINADYTRTGRPFRITNSGGGYFFNTLPEYADYLDQAFPEKKSPHLSRAAIEVLAIVAIQQPITKRQMEKIRGSSCEQPIKKLIELGFITPVSKLDTPGKPFLFGTTNKFLEHFGLARIDDIPTIEELKELLD
jgi:segregation and condensation protein B